MSEPIRVLVADDHPIVRQGLKTFLDIQPDLSVVAEARDGDEALALIAAHEPDVVLLDLNMPGSDGAKVLTRLAASDHRAKVIVLTSVTEAVRVTEAVAAGAAGFLYKDIDPDSLAQAIRSVADGQVIFAREAVTAMTAPAPGPVAALTAREREVLALVAAGRSNREIAKQLSVAEKTVKTHLSSLFRKLGVADRTQAALYAVTHGMAGHTEGRLESPPRAGRQSAVHKRRVWEAR
ncbi:response regulator [Stackebrandtia nassauensis]|uniref:Two component transcriptional regulator, LuxR family n=1 Tax=Stackebrandtia nassauensis (strain DSM 44728 / CIP 108903 / NRRL B-16338 / NBRC 102104 / LLR-40K-21) TaxID=446470 RepID=D3PXS2_STANL|nr:response regulator transcription factor [Stackebrandtia nassauensis]ADD43402.1 two component transcriptional regulator, LuxR family [Stackebrandtia nassauensis DSM 44728]